MQPRLKSIKKRMLFIQKEVR